MVRTSIRLENSIYLDIMTINGWKDHYDALHKIFEWWNAEVHQNSDDSLRAAYVESMIYGRVSEE